MNAKVDVVWELELIGEIEQKLTGINLDQVNGLAFAEREQAFRKSGTTVGRAAGPFEVHNGKMIDNKIELIINIVRDSGGRGAEHFKARTLHAWIVTSSIPAAARISTQVIHS